MNTERSQRLTFVNNNDLKFIQEFVNTKVYNPDLIEKLKLKQLRKLQLQKVRLNQKNLQNHVQKLNYNLLKLKKTSAELKVTSQIKDQESQKTEKDITQIEQKIQQLLNPSKQDENQENGSKNYRMKELISSIESFTENFDRERQIFKQQIEGKRQIISIRIQKKDILSQSSLNVKRDLNDKKFRSSCIKAKINEKVSLVRSSKELKLKISQAINQKLVFKKQILQNTKVKASQNAKAQEQCIQKLAKFVKELNLIIDDPQSNLDQKKNMIDLLLNVYCPDEKVKIQARSLSISPEKQKHNSISTRVSFQNNSQLSEDDENNNKNIENEIKIPFILLHSLDQMAIKHGLISKLIDSQFKLKLNARRISGDQQTEMKPQLQKIDQRSSLPSSLNQKDLHDQFLAYCQNQLNQLETTQNFLSQKEFKIQKQIDFLKQKCKQKDAEISSIIEQNRQSFKR